jgi:hypothetical protein
MFALLSKSSIEDCKYLTSLEISGAADATFRRKKLPTAAAAAAVATVRFKVRGVGSTVLVGRGARVREGERRGLATARFGDEAGRTTGRGRGFTRLAFFLVWLLLVVRVWVRLTLVLRRAALLAVDREATPRFLGAGRPPRIRFADPLRFAGISSSFSLEIIIRHINKNRLVDYTLRLHRNKSTFVLIKLQNYINIYVLFTATK